MNTLIGRKTEQVQRFLEDGKRIPVTVIRMPDVAVTQLKTVDTDGYAAVQLGVDSKKESKTTKSIAGHVKKSGVKTPLFLREVRVTADDTLPEIGSVLKVEELLEVGDIVWVTGTSKGKGFAGGVKRYGFKGGPRTHGQSDRERAPGSIGQTTTPGRVYKGKRMAGNMGNEQVTIKNLEVVAVDSQTNTVMVAGLVPGLIGSFVTVVKMGTTKTPVPLLKNAVETKIAEEETARQEAEALKAQEAESNAAENVTEQATPEAAVDEPKPEAAVEPDATEVVATDAPVVEETATPTVAAETPAAEEAPTEEAKPEAEEKKEEAV